MKALKGKQLQGLDRLEAIRKSVPRAESKSIHAFIVARWPKGPKCPRCGSEEVRELHHTWVKENHRTGWWKCGNCKRPDYHFSPVCGTIFEKSHVPLHTWFRVITEMCVSKEGLSTTDVHRLIGGTQRTAQHISMRIRAALDSVAFGRFGLPKGTTAKATMNPISLHPLTFEDALRVLTSVETIA